VLSKYVSLFSDTRFHLRDMKLDRKQKDRLKELLLINTAILESMEASLRADSASVWKYAGFKEYARRNNELIKEVLAVVPIDTRTLGTYEIGEIPSSDETFAIQQKYIFESVYTNLSILKAWLENKLDLLADDITNLRDFLQANLRKAVFKIPDKEVDVQDTIEGLIIGRGLAKGIDYDRETGRVKISIKEVIPDFVFKKLGLALEVKLSKNKDRSKAIVGEINDDIRSYSKEYPFLLFVVYDVGTIRDEVEFKQDLEIDENVSVVVVKH